MAESNELKIKIIRPNKGFQEKFVRSNVDVVFGGGRLTTIHEEQIPLTVDALDAVYEEANKDVSGTKKVIQEKQAMKHEKVQEAAVKETVKNGNEEKPGGAGERIQAVDDAKKMAGNDSTVSGNKTEPVSSGTGIPEKNDVGHGADYHSETSAAESVKPKRRVRKRRVEAETEKPF